MLDLALKMLLGDRAKYIMLISGLTFASLLMTEQAAIFCGIMQWSGSTLDNVGAPIWVVDPMVEQVNDTEALRDTDLNRVRSVEGVAWAAPFYHGMVRTRMRDGSFKFVNSSALTRPRLPARRKKSPTANSTIYDCRTP